MGSPRRALLVIIKKKAGSFQNDKEHCVLVLSLASCSCCSSSVCTGNDAVLFSLTTSYVVCMYMVVRAGENRPYRAHSSIISSVPGVKYCCVETQQTERGRDGRCYTEHLVCASG